MKIALLLVLVPLVLLICIASDSRREGLARWPALESIQEFDAFIRLEAVKWAKAVKHAGVPLQ